MRFKLMALAVLALTVALASVIGAQEEQVEESEGTVMDVGGGVYVPVPRELRPEAEVIAPPSGPTLPQEDEVERTTGRESTRQALTVEGEEVQVRQSTRVSGVSLSNSQDRFNWFYDARQVYSGVIPLIRDSLPHILGLQERGENPAEPNEVTWIGFEPLSDRTRVFVQLARAPSYRVEEFEEGQIVTLVLDNTRLSLSNWTRPVDTSYFDRSVQLIDAERLPDQRARVVIWRDGDESYTVDRDGDYLFVEFDDVRHRPGSF